MGGTLGERIRIVRGKMTQSDFANLISCPQAYISRYENGVVKPSIDFIYNLVRVFNVSLEWLMTGDGDMYAPRNTSRSDAMEQEIMEIVKILRSNNKILPSLKVLLNNKKFPVLLESMKHLDDEKTKALIVLLKQK